jgi:hypothetical protein
MYWNVLGIVILNTLGQVEMGDLLVDSMSGAHDGCHFEVSVEFLLFHSFNISFIAV